MFRHQMCHPQGACFVTLLNYISTIAAELSLVELQIIKNARYMHRNDPHILFVS